MRLPKTLKKPIPASRFRNKFLKKIYSQEESKIFEACFKYDEAKEVYSLKTDLASREKKKLLQILRGIKQSKLSLKSSRLISIAVIISLVVVFNIFFKNKLVERAIELGLQSLTKAKVECDAAYFSLIKAEIGFRRLAVTNPNNYMSNIVELGRTRIDLELWPLFSKKVLINELIGEEIQWNTPRTSSGELKSSPLQSKLRAMSPIKVAPLNLDGLSPEAILQENLEKLKSYQLAQELISTYQNKPQEWEQKIKDYESDFYELEREGKSLLSIDPNGLLRDPSQIPPTISRLSAAINKVNEQRLNIERDIREIDFILRDIESKLNSLEGIKNADILFIQNLANSISNFTFFQPIVEAYVRASLNRYTIGGTSIYGALQRFQAQTNEEDKRAIPVPADQDRRRQTLVYNFPTRSYPKFYLRKLLISMGEEAAVPDPFIKLELAELSSDPNINNKATKLAINARVPELRGELNGELDLRTGRHSGLLDLSLRDISFGLGRRDFDNMGIKFIDTYNGALALEAKLALDLENRSTRGDFKGNITNKGLDSQANNLLEQLIVKVIEDTSSEIGLKFVVVEEDLSSLEIQSNLDKLLIKALLELSQEQLANLGLVLGLDEISRELNKLLGADLVNIDEISSAINLVAKDGLSLDEASKALSSTLAGKNSSINKLVEEQANRVKEEALKRAEQELQKLVPAFPKLF